MSAPDLSTLANRMRFAASVLEEAGTRYEAYDPTFNAWDAQKLRCESDHVEAEDREAAEHEAQVEEIAALVFTSITGRPWSQCVNQHRYRVGARALIADGWRK